MYKFQEPDWRGDQEPGVLRLADSAWIPFNLDNRDYKSFLQAILDEGTDILEGEPHPKLQKDLETFTFNQQLNKYATAVLRLSQYVLSQGRAETKQMMATGEQVFNEETNEMEPVLTEVTAQSKIDPLPLTIEVSEMNDITMEMVVTTIDNPAIVQDIAQRAAAQTVVDATPELVVAAYENTLG
jgi:inorganic pyrophosphatase/exopolyphosphatase